MKSLIFKGRAFSISTSDTLTVTFYDALQKLNSEYIPKNEGLYASTDAGAIIKDIIANSNHDFNAAGVSSTGVIIDEIDLTDKTRLAAIKLILIIVNGEPDADIYHIRAEGDDVVLSVLPDYESQEPALIITGEQIFKGTLSVEEDGSSFFNCATVIGQDSEGNEIRAYYPGIENPNGSFSPDFPDNPIHHLITDSGLRGISQCYQVARGFIKAHNIIPKIISFSFRPTRFDYFPGQSVQVDAFEYGVDGVYRLREINYDTDSSKRVMSISLSEVPIKNITSYTKL